MIFQGAIILPHIVVYHNKSKALAPWKVKQKRANKPKKKRLTKMIDVYKHALIGGNGVPHFGPKV
jgi:lipopolysaccharide export system protein LptC